MSYPRRFQSAASLTLGLILAGCGGSAGPELVPVTGVIRLNGQPLAEAQVVFQPSGDKASPSLAVTDSDGQFRLRFNRQKEGAMPGEHVVKVTTERLVTDSTGKETTKPELVPERYNRRSELQREVKSGDQNHFDIDLQSPATPGRRQGAPT